MKDRAIMLLKSKRRVVGMIMMGIVFLYAAYVFTAVFVRYAFSEYYIGFYDGIHRLLPHFYIRQGLIPYRDFDHGYAPGLFILIGKIIPFTSIIQRNMILAGITLGCTGIGLFLVCRLMHTGTQKIIAASVYLMLTMLVVHHLAWSDPLSVVIVSVVFLLSISLLFVHGKKKYVSVGITVTSGILMFLRWDWILSFGLFLGLAGYVYHRMDRFLRHRGHKVSMVYWHLIQSVWAGIGIGGVLLLLYLWSIGAFFEGIDSIFLKQIVLNAQYRHIPLSALMQYTNEAVFLLHVLFSCVASAVVTFRLRNRISHTHIPVVLIIYAGIASQIPYALSRVDTVHLIPLISLFGIGSVVLYKLTSSYWHLIVVGVLLGVMLRGSTTLRVTKPDINAFDREIAQSIQDCKNAVPRHISYRSLFVGRENYDRITSSIGSLYLINPNIPPASAYTFDVPGIQTSCKYAGDIVNQLTRAAKPMLAFLDLTDFDPENEAIATLKSCGKVESFLRTRPYTTIGTCRAFSHQFVIRSYK